MSLMLLALLLISAGVELSLGGFYVGGQYFFPVGVNYMPRDSAVFMWKNFDPDKIRTEFKTLRAMGLNTVRVFIFWEDINPEPGVISRTNLDRIKALMGVAHEEGLMVIPTLFTGHMSGGNWAPEWMKGKSGPGVYQKEPFRPPMLHLPRTFRDIYEDELAKDNAFLQARTLATELGGHPALLYRDLGNEPRYWQRPRIAVTLLYRLRRIKRPKRGVRVEKIPWALGKSRLQPPETSSFMKSSLDIPAKKGSPTRKRAAMREKVKAMLNATRLFSCPKAHPWKR